MTWHTVHYGGTTGTLRMNNGAYGNAQLDTLSRTGGGDSDSVVSEIVHAASSLCHSSGAILYLHENGELVRYAATSECDGDSHLPINMTAIETRSKPVSDIEQGYITAASCILANISCQLGRTLVWDSDKGRVVDDDEANRLLRRPYRRPWIHPEPENV